MPIPKASTLGISGLYLLCLLSTSPLLSQTLYVDNLLDTEGCTDYQPVIRRCGTGDAVAFNSIHAAATRVDAGTTVLIQPGTYTGGIVVRRGGTASEPVIFRSIGPGVTISGSGENRDAFYITEADFVQVDGITIEDARRAGLRISLSDHVEVRNSTFRNNGSWGIFSDFSDYTLVENCEASGSRTQHGIYISNSSDYPTIRANRIFDNAAAGVHMNGDASMGGDGLVSHAVIEKNVIYENGRRGGSAINLDGVTDSLIRNNLLFDNHASGISLYRIDGADQSHSNQVLNNTIVNGRFSRWALNLPSTRDNRVFNNIILNKNRFRGSISVGLPVDDGFESDYNVLMDRFELNGDLPRSLNLQQWQDLGYDRNSQLGDLRYLFVDRTAGDYRPAPNSEALDSGKPLTGEVVDDIDGRLRPYNGAYDIGAHEWHP